MVKTRWICTICGYIHEGDQPPEACPICAVGPELFVKDEVEDSSSDLSESSEDLLIIGAGIAGISAAESARKYSPDSKITLISNEKDLPYYRMALTRFLAGEITESELLMRSKESLDKNRIDFLKDTTIESIDHSSRQAISSDGQKFSYSKLILTTGSTPFIPPIEGSNFSNIFTLRSKNDADNILRKVASSKRAVVIGGGILGLETAGALSSRGCKVTIVENGPWLLSRQLNKDASELLEKFINSKGISLLKESITARFSGSSMAEKVYFKDGSHIDGDIFCIATGVRPQSRVAKDLGCKVDRGVVVSDEMETTVENIFAAGDIAQFQGVVTGTWAPAQIQGEIAGANAMGQKKLYTPPTTSLILKVLGIPLCSLGDPISEGGELFTIRSDESYTLFRVVDQILTGAIFVGDTALATATSKMIGIEISATTAEEIVSVLNNQKEDAHGIN